MATGKVLLLTRSMMDKPTLEVFKSLTPAGWQATVIDLDKGDQQVAEELQDTEYLFVLGSGRIPDRFVENARKLKLIQNGGQDTGHLPVKWALERGIYVANAGGANAIAVAEFTVLLMMNCLRRIPYFSENIRGGKFRGDMNRDSSFELFDKTVGVVGFGNIGRRVALLCHAYGANIIYHERLFVPFALRADSKAKPASLDELLTKADIVTIHVPSLTANRALIGWEQLSKMKPTAYLINTSRGSNIDEKALASALNEKKIAGAGLDVWDPEPPDPNNPLLHMDNVVATPHVAGLARENTAARFEAMWRNVVLVSEGKEPLNRKIEF